jgi:hypothetical protein
MAIRVRLPDLDHWKAQVKCQAGCPVATDAGRYIQLIAEGRDEALVSGNADQLVKGITYHVEEGIREWFARAAAAKKQADAGVTAGREFVEAYVELTHYVERLHLDATTLASHGAGASAAEHKH